MPCFSPTAFERLQQLFANITPNPASRATVVCPDSFCQIIYKGTALLAGTQPYFVPSMPKRNLTVVWYSVPADVWQHTQLVYICSPGNPTGAVIREEWRKSVRPVRPIQLCDCP